MTFRRRVAYVATFLLLGLAVAQLGRWLFPSEADRLGEAVEALGQRVLAGDFEAVLEHVDLERYGLRASAMGESRTFGPDDADRLLERARESASWLPLERASIEVVGAEVGPDGAGDDTAAVAVKLSFEDEGTHYADVFDLTFRRSAAATGGERWVLTEVRLRPSRDAADLISPYRRP